MGFQSKVRKKETYFYEKKAVLQTVSLMHSKARHVLYDLFSTNQGHGSEITFVAGVTKISIKKFENLAIIG